MAKVIIHIGLHKTGTSALQRYLADNSEQLLKEGILYKLQGTKWPNHHPVAVGYAEGNIKPYARAFVRATMEEAGDNTVLFSSEMFSERGFDIASFLEDLAGHDVTVYAYIRNPCDQTVSAHNQLVRENKSRRTVPIHAKPRPYDPSYYYYLRAWMERTKLVICPYDPKQWYFGSVITDFFHTTGIAHEANNPADVRANVSLTHDLVEAVRYLNIAGIAEQDRARIIELLSHVEAKKSAYPLTADQCEDLIGEFRERLEQYRPLFRPGFDESYLLRNPALATAVPA